MNVLILSAILGVVALFSGIYLKQKSTVRAIAIVGMAGLLISNILEMNGTSFFNINT